MEALDAWETALANTIQCPRCGAEPGKPCVYQPDFFETDNADAWEPHTHPLRLTEYYKKLHAYNFAHGQPDTSSHD